MDNENDKQSSPKKAACPPDKRHRFALIQNLAAPIILTALATLIIANYYASTLKGQTTVDIPHFLRGEWAGFDSGEIMTIIHREVIMKGPVGEGGYEWLRGKGTIEKATVSYEGLFGYLFGQPKVDITFDKQTTKNIVEAEIGELDEFFLSEIEGGYRVVFTFRQWPDESWHGWRKCSVSSYSASTLVPDDIVKGAPSGYDFYLRQSP